MQHESGGSEGNAAPGRPSCHVTGVVDDCPACAAQMRGTLSPGQPWDVVVDLFFYREPEEAKEDGEDAGDAFGGVQDTAAGYGGQGLPAPPGVHRCSCCPACCLLRSSLFLLPARFDACVPAKGGNNSLSCSGFVEGGRSPNIACSAPASSALRGCEGKSRQTGTFAGG